jgi:serine/threonine protein kinase
MRCVFKLSNEDEVVKLRIMNAAIPSNCAKVYAAIPISESMLLVLERKPGVLLHNTMVSNVSELLQLNFTKAEVVHVLYQCAYMLKQLQTRIPGFSHNDLKSDNILLTPWTGEGAYCPPFACVFIDAETVRGEGLSSRFMDGVDPAVLSMFALEGESCEWLDFHLILLEICHAVRKTRPPWRDAFFALVHSFCSDDLLLTFKEGGTCVTTFNRLTLDGRVRSKECKSLEDSMSILHDALPEGAHV